MKRHANTLKAAACILLLALAFLVHEDYGPAAFAGLLALVLLANLLPGPECGQNCRQGRKACRCQGTAP